MTGLVHAIFEQRAVERPASVAVACAAATLTYAELDGRATSLAQVLIEHGVQPGSIVSFCLDRSLEAVVSILAILKAGAAYLPLDPGYPARRLEYICADASPSLHLTTEAHRARLTAPGSKTLLVDGVASRPASRPGPAGPPSIAESGTAYVNYTSGSTGSPKGVAVPHRAVAHFIRETAFIDFGPDRVFLQMAPMSFDATTFELWGPLLHGGKCVLFPYQQVTIGRLHQIIEAHAIDALYLPCALFNCIVDERPEILAPVDTVVVGGEALSLHHARKAQRCLPHVELVNGYGPTECTTFSTSFRVSGLSDEHRSVPIGRPLRNVRAYVLDDAMQDVAPGEEGELYIGGPGVASGYLNRPELTAQRFVMRPSPEGGEQRLYRTGDVVRWLADGDLEFLGRNDSQIKVNGFRVEAGEVETQLCRIEGVRQAVVLLKDTGYDHKTLVAFVTGDPDIGRKTAQVRERLQAELPEYMVPREIVWLAELPLTVTGKVDRTQLQRGRTS